MKIKFKKTHRGPKLLLKRIWNTKTKMKKKEKRKKLILFKKQLVFHSGPKLPW